MDPLSEEIQTAVYEWRQNERRHRGFTEIYADRIKTETALFYDAVQTFLLAYIELNAKTITRSEQLQCSQPSEWEYGALLVKKLSQVISVIDATSHIFVYSNNELPLQMTNRGMTGRVLFDNEGHRTDFYMEVLEMNAEGFKKIAILDPKTMKISYTRTSEEVYSQVTQSLQNKTVIVASILGAPFLTHR